MCSCQRERQCLNEATRKRSKTVHRRSASRRQAARRGPATLSPFQFPRDQLWLRPIVIRWLKSLPYRPALFIDPFPGNGSVSLAIAELNLADRVVMAERSPAMAAVWKVALGKSWDLLQKKILKFEPTRNSVRRELMRKSRGQVAVAFRCLLKDRLDPGGLIGPDLLRLVKRGKRLRRWHAKTLAANIARIQELKHRIQLVQADGPMLMEKYLFRRRAVFFVDPPYTRPEPSSAPLPPRSHPVDYDRLGKLIQSAWADSLLTCPGGFDPKQFAAAFGLQTSEVWVSAGRRRRRRELLLTKLSDEEFFYPSGAAADGDDALA